MTEEKKTKADKSSFLDTYLSDERSDVFFIPPEMNPVYSTGMSGFIPLGLLSLTACLRNKGITSTIYRPDRRLFNIDDYKAVAKLILSKNPKIIGFSTWCTSYPAALILAEQIKLVDKNTLIIFGGPQASILAAETLENFGFVDYVLQGEADFSLPKLVSALLGKKKRSEIQNIEGLYFRNDFGKAEQIEEASFIPDLDILPVPAYELLHHSKVLKMDIGRGCPYKCTYCSTSGFFSRKYRTKSVARIIMEMDQASEITGNFNFSFTHDMFTLNRKFVRDLCSALENHRELSGKHYIWSCSARIDHISKEDLSIMSKAGCRAIFFGIESGSQNVQQMIKKNLDLSSTIELADTCRNLGIDIHASFIIGFPFETRDDIEKTLLSVIEFSLRGAYTQISELSLLPGTPIYLEFRNDLKFDGSFSNFSHSVISPVEGELIRKFPFIFSSFYYLPVNSMDRESITLLSRLINHLEHFRNTIFLLRKIIRNDLNGKGILELCFALLAEIKENQKGETPLVSLWIDVLKKYILSKTSHEVPMYWYDVFIFEATQSLLKDRFIRWQVIHRHDGKVSSADAGNDRNKKLTSTLFWDIIISGYELSSIVPSKNGWVTEKLKLRKGKYHYLIVAVSEGNCNLTKLSAYDYKVLDDLRKKSPEDFFKTGSMFKTEKRMNQWSEKMIRLGVLEQMVSQDDLSFERKLIHE